MGIEDLLPLPQKSVIHIKFKMFGFKWVNVVCKPYRTLLFINFCYHLILEEAYILLCPFGDLKVYRKG